MGRLHPLPKKTTQDDAPPLIAPDATVTRLEHRCALCGERLSTRALRHQLVPPQSANKPITVCHTCSKAALGEGYRLAD